MNTHRLAFRPTFRSIGWDGHFRKNMSIITGLIHNAEWSLNSSSKIWFDENGNNTIPHSLANSINNLDDINNFIIENNSSLIRWDMTWNLCRTLRHQNRYGPEFSAFNSYAIKSFNNILPTISNMQRRLPDLYNNWKCHFCMAHDETTDHLFKCDCIDWTPIKQDVTNATIHLAQRLNLRTNLDLDKIFIQPQPIQHSILPSPIASLAMGIMPSYVLAQLRSSGILHHSTVIGTHMLKSAMKSFRKHIWTERCNRQAEKEHRLGITKNMKKAYGNGSSSTDNTVSNAATTTAYHAMKEKWKEALDRGLSKMDQIVRLGHHGSDYGWAHYNNISRNFSNFI